MSLSYNIVEKSCYLINSLPGKGVKGIMFKGAEVLADKEDIPKTITRSGIRFKKISYKGFTMHLFRKKSQKHSNGQAVFFLPGGGGMTRATYLHYHAARKIAVSTGADVFVVNYPLAPKYNASYALDWLEEVYAKLLKKYKAGNITFMGDSAGANLILSLCGRVPNKPGGLIVISPACGLNYGKERDIRLAMERQDPILSVEMNDIIAENWCKGMDIAGPDMSPEAVDYTGFPPIYFFYGQHELFYPHVINYIDKIDAQGVNFKKEVEPMCHDWALCFFFPEGREAVRKMCEFVTAHRK